MELPSVVLKSYKNPTKNIAHKDLSLSNCMKGLKVAVGLAVIRTKPNNLSGVEFAKALYSLTVNKKSDDTKKNKEIKELLNSISSFNTLSPGKPNLCSLHNKNLTVFPSKSCSPDKQISFLLSVAFLNKFDKFLSDKLLNFSSVTLKKDSISLSTVTDKIEIIYLETQSYLVRKKFSENIKVGMKLITKIANKLEVFCYIEGCDPFYKAVLSFILNKTIEIVSLVQQYILEATSFQDYFYIKRYTEVVEILSVSASLFTTIVKTLSNCLSTFISKLASTIFSSKDNSNNSRLNVCLFTNTGHLMNLLSKIFTIMIDLVLYHKNKDSKQNEIQKSDEKTKCDIKIDHSLVNKSVNKVVNSNTSSRLSFILKSDGCNFDYVLDSLGCVDSWLSKDPLFIMFMVKIQSNVEDLIKSIDNILTFE